MQRLWKVEILFDNFTCWSNTLQINVPEYDMLSLNNSLFGFGITKLLLEVDLRIQASLLTTVGSNLSQMYKGASWINITKTRLYPP